MTNLEKAKRHVMQASSQDVERATALATIAVAEQQRIANLIAIGDMNLAQELLLQTLTEEERPSK